MSGVRVSEEEYLRLPETMDGIELLDGEVILRPPPSDRHQRILVTLVTELSIWARGHRPAAVRAAPLDVRFGPSRILQPDVFVVLDIVPDLTIEILSGRRSYDRFTKRVVYAGAGVAEYWVVDPETRTVEVYRGSESARVAEDVLESTVLPGFSLPLATLFEE